MPNAAAMFRYIGYSFDMSNKTVDRVIPRRVPVGLAEYEGDRQFATTLARGLELLRCFTPDDPVLGNKDLSQRLQLPGATVSRLTYTLMAMGYLAQAESNGKYRLGSAVLSVGYPLLELFGMRRRARPHMHELSVALGGAVWIGIRDRLNIVCIEASSHHRKVHALDVGTSLPLAGSAVGRACLMSSPPAERESILNQLRVKEPEQWQRYGNELQRNLAEFSRYGSCVSVGEIEPDVQAVAVPLGRIDRGEPAALNCSFGGKPLDRGWLQQEVAPRLQMLARQLM